MAPQQSKAGLDSARHSLAIFAALLLVVVLLQWLGSAYSSEFGSTDESPHFMTGLMIRDYIAAGFPATPMRFAEQYYLHYPKVAFGMWGPFLHVIEAAWTLVFPPTRISILLLMALITAGTAFLLYLTLVDEFGSVLALTAALIFVSIPVVQRFTGRVMADGLVALLEFWAAMAFGRYLNTRQAKYAIQFAVLVCLSLLTKGTGMALVVLPGFAILFARQFSILKDRYLWVAAAIVAFIGGPWQYYTVRAVLGIEERQPGWSFFLGYTKAMLGLVGIALLPVILLGIYARVIVPAGRRSLDGKWASAAALICSVWVFHCLIPEGGVELRYLIPVMLPMVMFLIAGISVLARWIRIPAITPQHRAWAVAMLVVAIFLTTAFTVPQKRYHGFDEVAELLERPEYTGSVFLVSSQAQDGEGMLISEIAMREKRPSHIILRATKMLSTSDWMGKRYQLQYQSPDAVMKFLKEVPVRVVVIHNEPGIPPYPDHLLLQETIAKYAAEWKHIGTYPQRRAAEPGSRIDVYTLESAAGQEPGKIRINLPYTLGHAIEH